MAKYYFFYFYETVLVIQFFLIYFQFLISVFQTHDIPVLRHLRDVRVRPDPDSKGEMDFRLEFVFGRNDFFSDRVLTKDYEVRMPETSAASDRTSRYCYSPGKKVKKVYLPIFKNSPATSRAPRWSTAAAARSTGRRGRT